MSSTITTTNPGFVIHEDLHSSSPLHVSSPTALEWEQPTDSTEEEYEADHSLLTSDEAVPSIETETHVPEDVRDAVKDLPTSSPPTASAPLKGTPRRISALTAASRQSAVSSLPSSLPHDDYDISAFTPMKNRPAFRNAGSYRAAIQMASPPQFDTCSSSRSSSQLRDRQIRYPKSERRYGSPHSKAARSTSTTRSSRQETPSREVSIQSATPSRKEYPLILLHVTVLQQPWPYSAKSMEAVLPEAIITNQHLLEEKLSHTVLARGLLIPHPRDEYDVLEERILESLELKTPRVLKCGHYYREDSGDEELDDNITVTRGCPGVACQISPDGDEDVFGRDAHCSTCHSNIKFPGTGLGEGNRRWDVKIYAANGLMRSGAWAAAWSEMERVDVEIGPWVPEHLKRELDRVLEEEEQEALIAAQVSEEERRRVEESEARTEHPRHRMEELKSRMAAGPEKFVNVTEEERESQSSETFAVPAEKLSRPTSRTSSQRTKEDIPLSTLLQNYALLLAQDRRNIAIAVLSVLVLLISMSGGSKSPSPVAPIQQPLEPPVTVTSTSLDCITSSVLHTSFVTVTESSNQISAIVSSAAPELSSVHAPIISSSALPEPLSSPISTFSSATPEAPINSVLEELAGVREDAASTKQAMAEDIAKSD